MTAPAQSWPCTWQRARRACTPWQCPDLACADHHGDVLIWRAWVPCVRADPILQLATSVLGVSTIMVSLLDGDKKFVKNAAGFVPDGAVIEPPAICHWSLVPQVHQMVVVEDTLLDARCARRPRRPGNKQSKQPCLGSRPPVCRQHTEQHG